VDARGVVDVCFRRKSWGRRFAFVGHFDVNRRGLRSPPLCCFLDEAYVVSKVDLKEGESHFRLRTYRNT